jgi:hypothetical protein
MENVPGWKRHNGPVLYTSRILICTYLDAAALRISKALTFLESIKALKSAALLTSAKCG